MQLVISDFNAHFGKTGERFVVRSPGEPPRELPAHAVSHVLIAGPSVTFSTDAIRLACEKGAAVSFLSYNGEP